MSERSGRVLDAVGTVARLGLAAVFLISGGIKAADPDQTYLAVRAYEVLPPNLATVVADVLPWLEIAIGVLLLLGIGTRLVAGVAAAVLVVFMLGVIQAWARGLSIDCGCFGGGGAVAPEETRYGEELLRDTLFLLLAVWLLVRPRSMFALDSQLGRAQPRPVGEGRHRP